jgi:hypothetical protein
MKLPPDIFLLIATHLPSHVDLERLIAALEPTDREIGRAGANRRRGLKEIAAEWHAHAQAVKFVQGQRRKHLLAIANDWIAAADGALAVAGSAAIPAVASRGLFRDVDVFHLKPGFDPRATFPLDDALYTVTLKGKGVCRTQYPREFSVIDYDVHEYGVIQLIAARNPCDDLSCDDDCNGVVEERTLAKVLDRFDIPHAMVGYTVPGELQYGKLHGTVEYNSERIPVIQKRIKRDIAAGLERAFKYRFIYGFELDTTELDEVARQCRVFLCLICKRGIIGKECTCCPY